VSSGLPRVALALGIVACVACRGGSGSGSETGSGSSADPLADARAALAAGRYDEVLARVGGSGDPEASYLAGRAWAAKAASVPLPSAAPGTPPGPRLKAEEEKALSSYESAVAARPDFVDAQLALAALLQPHAIAATAAATRRPGQPSQPADNTVARVLRAYADAVQGDPADTKAVEALIDFASKTGRFVEAEAAYQELIRRRREDPGPLVRYGDFLAGPGGKPDAALAQYAQALIWRPDDSATQLKMAEIHLAAAAEHLRNLQYVAAEARLKDARRYLVDPKAPQVARLTELERVLREVRGR
jgi:tetratricopeptide (TPR) repeat protein